MKSDFKICENCNNFFQTGLAKSMSNGEMGYCLIIQNDKRSEVLNSNGIPKAKPQAIVKKTDTCSKFKNKNTIANKV